MDFQLIKTAIKINSSHLITSEDKQSIRFKNNKTRFAVCDNGEYFNMYQLTEKGVFLPGSKIGDSIQSVNNFVKARAN
ncbi:hypothetical protein CJF42_25310 [Pseudoalteromonas sp. NBT06-2]|uniref:hypothetical protein n=1 Tax=Pseudoalteromonas sp. NBT06-2 TaxID=2025950 RepID=UPI000BA60F0A|nr:hypothetical protein [Pseudoalteromonas sp. NBT06-2]PAJ71702.1 hypothetical protein CJF42_25310 [Pseudoalteromonas sp. NBT06-2]